jgi:hypothetical protein
MAKATNKISDGGILKNSWDLWNALIGNGLDSFFYDREFLNGNTSFDGLGTHLSLPLTKGNIVSVLKKNNVSTNTFINAFFKTLQPYAQMMNDLCEFFASYQVSLLTLV